MSALPRPGPYPRSTACFSVQAPAGPSVAPRLLEVFVKRGLVPAPWHSTVTGSRSESLEIDVQVPGQDAQSAARPAEALRLLVRAGSVLAAEKRGALTA